jgi:hypothetical protein
LAGVLARVENAEIKSKVERCDACGRYETDAAAENALRELLKEERINEPNTGANPSSRNDSNPK